VRESDIEGYFTKRVKALGGEVRKLRWIGRRGAPDRLAFVPRGDKWLVLWVEFKAPGKKPTILQEREHARLRKAGQAVAVIDSMLGVDMILGKP